MVSLGEGAAELHGVAVSFFLSSMFLLSTCWLCGGENHYGGGGDEYNEVDGN